MRIGGVLISSASRSEYALPQHFTPVHQAIWWCRHRGFRDAAAWRRRSSCDHACPIGRASRSGSDVPRPRRHRFLPTDCGRRLCLTAAGGAAPLERAEAFEEFKLNPEQPL